MFDSVETHTMTQYTSAYPMEDFRADVAELFRMIKACEESRERLEAMIAEDNSKTVH